MLPAIIQPKQTCFIQGHFTLDNIITIWEGMEWAHKSHQATMFIKIDFEKSYDQIEWSSSSPCFKPLALAPSLFNMSI